MTNFLGTAKDTIVIGDETFEIVESSRIIEAKSKKGTTYWQGHRVIGAADYFYTCTSSWSTTKDGGLSKKVWSTPYFAEPKNIGKANETTNERQSELEFASMVQKEIDTRESSKPLPMLAQPFRHSTDPKKGREKHIKYPAMVQPKFDGMRMLYDGSTGWSRGNKELIKEVIDHLHFDTQGMIIDGELILPDNPTVNVTSSATKRFQAGVSDKLVYRVYDIVDTTMPYHERYLKLANLVKTCDNHNVILAETHYVNNPAEINTWHNDFCDRGFEGTIIRNANGKYAIDERSNDLQKHKDFETAEFLITDVIESGGGSSAGVGKFVCEADNGNRFESTATGDMAQRKEYFTNKAEYIGKYAVVKFRELSGATMVPFHSNVLDIRETKSSGY